MKRLIRLLIAGSAILGFATPLSARPTPITVDAAADWAHEQSGFTFPARITDMERTEVMDFGTDRLDVAAVYGRRGRGTWASVYAFRAGLPDVSIWSDRLRFVVTSTDLGTTNPSALELVPFAPPNGAEGTALRMAAPLEGGYARATGFTVMRVDDWLYVVRFSSTVLDKTTLEAALIAFTQSLPLAAGTAAAPQAYAIAPCEDRLPDRRARRVQQDMAAALIASVGALSAEQVEEDPDDAAPQNAPRYCRDLSSVAAYGVYRSGQPSTGYVIAIGDAGAGALVRPDSASALMGGRRGQFALTLRTVKNDLNYGSFDRMPPPEQAMQTLQSTNPISGVARPTNGQSDRTVIIQTNR